MKRRPFALLAALALAGCSLFEEHGHKPQPDPDLFPRSVEGLEPVLPMQTVTLRDGDTLRLTAAPAKMALGGREVRMLAYNGSIPGPLVRVPEGASITVLLENRAGLPTSLHSHGVRMDYRSDGDAVSAPAIPDGGSAAYSLRFPDPGVYWYHPHVREDYGLELGLYGNYHVIPKDTAFWPPADREEFLVVSDVLLDGNGDIAPFRKDQATHAMMGRFGNRFLVNGDTDYVLEVKRNELVRFYVTNACGSRVLDFGRKRGDVRMVGSDNGPLRWPLLSGRELIAPGERAVLEAFFADSAGDTLMHITPDRNYPLGRVRVRADSAVSGHYRRFYSADSNPAALRSIAPFLEDLDKAPDKLLLLTVRMGGHGGHVMPKAAAPAHSPDGIEWEDHMGEANAGTKADDITWIIRDASTNLENHAIHWTFNQGDRVKIRILNDPGAMHPMPHPIHFHGQRFLVTAVNGDENELELGWKDTYLVGRGETTDILLDASNPGEWMAHCHIPEHLESNMMFHFTVKPAVVSGSREP